MSFEEVLPMNKERVVLLTGIAMVALALGVRLLLPYPTVVYFIFPFGIGVAALTELLRSRALAVVVGLLSFAGSLVLSAGPFEVDGARTLLISPLMPIGFMMALIGGSLFSRHYLGTLWLEDEAK
jgi:hypothetical protein